MSATSWSATHAPASRPPKSWILTMCVVAVMVVIFVCLVVNSLAYARNATGRNHAVLLMVKMTEAFQKFKDEYTSLPVTAPDENTPLDTKGPFLAALLAQEKTINPHDVICFDPPFFLGPKELIVQNSQGEWELRDAWGNMYKIQVDLDADGKISNPAKEKKLPMVSVMPPGFIIYSAGPDGDFATWEDNVCSWK